MKRKIMFVVNVDWFFVSHRLPLAIEAVKRGYEVHLACSFTDKQDFLRSIGIILHPISLSRSGRGILNEIRSLLEIKKVLKAVRPDVAHFVTIKPVIYGGIAAKLAGVRNRVFSISGLGYIFISSGLKSAMVRLFIRKLYKLALSGENSHIIVQNPDDRKILSDINAVSDSSIIMVRGSGAELDKYVCKPEKDGKPTVVMASRLLKDKGVFEYVEAAELLIKKGICADFRLYGDPDEGNPASLTDTDLSEISAKGYVAVNGFSDRISEIFADANLVVLPSYREGLPKVLIEAAACGRAVVTTDVPGCRDAITPDVSGLLVRVRNVDDLAEKMERLIVDSKLRHLMGAEGRKLAESEFDVREVVRKHFELYESFQEIK